MADYEKLYKEACGVIEELLLNDKINIKDIPQSLRVTEEGYGFYVYAFRVSRNATIERFIADLCLLCEDISTLDAPDTYRYLFEKEFVDYVWTGGDFDEEGKKQLEVYRNGLSESFVQGLSETSKYYWDDYKAEFDEHRAEEQAGLV